MTPVLSNISFVGIFSQPLAQMPNLPLDFIRRLFDNPFDTVSGMSPEGYFIRRNNRQTPSVVITPVKIIFNAEEEEALLKYTDRFAKQLDKIGTKYSFSAYGLNYEYQLTDIKGDYDEWLWGKFIKNDVMTEFDFKRCPSISLRLAASDTEIYNVSIGLPSIITSVSTPILTINHHHASTLEKVPTPADMHSLFEASLKLVDEKIISFIK